MNKFYQEKYLEFKMLVDDIKELLSKTGSPPKETVMVDNDVQKMLKISKRKLAQLRAGRKITYHQPDDKPAN